MSVKFRIRIALESLGVLPIFIASLTWDGKSPSQGSSCWIDFLSRPPEAASIIKTISR